MNALSRRALLPCCLVAVAMLAGCSKQVLDYRNAQFVDGKIYPSNSMPSGDDSNEPFSGTLTNLPESQLFSGNQSAMGAFLNIVVFGTAKATGASTQQLDPSIAGRFVLEANRAMCDVSVRKGLLDGRAHCTVSNSDTTSTQANFDEGNLDGDITYYDSNGNKLASGKFDEGAPRDAENVYSQKTGRLIFTARWGDTGLDGDVTAYDPITGNRVYVAHFSNGRLDGTASRYSPDGKHKMWVETFVNGKLDGTKYVWNVRGQLIGATVYKDGIIVPVEAQPVNCSAASAKHRILAEALICGNAQLIKDDAVLNSVYARVTKSDAGDSEQRYHHRYWIMESRDTCTNVACLEKAYDDELKYFVGPSQPSLKGIDCSLEQQVQAFPNVRAICSNPALMADDRAMMAAYKRAYAASLASGKIAIESGISEWVTDVQQACQANVQCLDTAYRTLTTKLNAVAHHPDVPIPDLNSKSPMPGASVLASTPVVTAPPEARITQRATSPQASEPASVSPAGSGVGTQPSFDCAKAGSVVEKMICSNGMLAEYDVRMTRRYQAALASSPNKGAVRGAQRAWMAQRNACTTLDCVSRAYQDRIKQLGGSL